MAGLVLLGILMGAYLVDLLVVAAVSGLLCFCFGLSFNIMVVSAVAVIPWAIQLLLGGKK